MAEQAHNDVVSAVLGIARATSGRGAGLSIRDALVQANYAASRDLLNHTQLLEALTNEPAFLEDWLRFSEDKRTAGGWYIKRGTCEVGNLSSDADAIRFDSLAEAVAAYVILELDFWANAA